MWWAGQSLGVWNGKEFALVMGKQDTQISRWLREDPKPTWEIIKEFAVRVGVSPTWLDDPKTPGAKPPELFEQWLRARREFSRLYPSARPDRISREAVENRVRLPREAAIEPEPIPAPRGKTRDEAVREYEKPKEKKPKRA